MKAVVCTRCGYQTDVHLRRIFKKHKGDAGNNAATLRGLVSWINGQFIILNLQKGLTIMIRKIFTSIILISIFCTLQNLNAADKPIVHPRENTEWIVHYSYNANKSDLPRVLLIGDSICKQYEKQVCKDLAGQCLCYLPGYVEMCLRCQPTCACSILFWMNIITM